MNTDERRLRKKELFVCVNLCVSAVKHEGIRDEKNRTTDEQW